MTKGIWPPSPKCCIPTQSWAYLGVTIESRLMRKRKRRQADFLRQTVFIRRKVVAVKQSAILIPNAGGPRAVKATSAAALVEQIG